MDKPKPMSESQVLKALVEKHPDIKQKTFREIFDSIGELAVKEAANGLKIPGIGKIVKVHRPERKGKDLRTGEEKVFPAKDVVKFRIAASLKKTILGK